MRSSRYQNARKSVAAAENARSSNRTFGPPKNVPRQSQDRKYSHNNKMSDTEMDGDVALDGASDTHSQLAARINGGAMDVNSVVDSTVSGRLYDIFSRRSNYANRLQDQSL